MNDNLMPQKQQQEEAQNIYEECYYNYNQYKITKGLTPLFYLFKLEIIVC